MQQRDSSTAEAIRKDTLFVEGHVEARTGSLRYRVLDGAKERAPEMSKVARALVDQMPVRHPDQISRRSGVVRLRARHHAQQGWSVALLSTTIAAEAAEAIRNTLLELLNGLVPTPFSQGRMQLAFQTIFEIAIDTNTLRDALLPLPFEYFSMLDSPLARERAKGELPPIGPNFVPMVRDALDALGIIPPKSTPTVFK